MVLPPSEERPKLSPSDVVPTAVTVLRETTPNREPDASRLLARTDGALLLSPALAAILSTTIQVAATAGPSFENAVHTDLQAIYDTPTGWQLLDSLHASGQKIYIHHAPSNSIELNNYNWTWAFYALDSVTPGTGLGVGVNYIPTLSKAGEMPWNIRPPGIGLAHELIHAEQAAYGRMRRFDTANPGGPDPRNPEKSLQVPHYELETIGVHPEHTYAYTENQIRAEWNPPQGRRDYY
jgi:type VI secretion system secreted protein VgrG